jgi:membrane protease YdiL (CAAX protease family)
MKTQIESSSQGPSPKEILKISIPLLIIYALIGQAANGYWIISQIGIGIAWIDILQHLYQFFMASILLLLIPIAVIRKKYHSNYQYFGCGKGDWQIGKILIGISPIAILIIYFGSTDPELIATYPLSKLVLINWGVFILYEISYGLMYYIPYEFHFRGFLQTGLSQKGNAIYSILIVTAITTALHWMKPISEILGAFFVGFFFGYLAYKTKSWWYVWWIHFFIGILTDTFCGLRFLGIM